MSTVRVYVNGRGVEAPCNGRAIDAIRASDPAVAALVVAGERALTDSRGLPLGADAPLYQGAILRVVHVRAAREGGTP